MVDSNFAIFRDFDEAWLVDFQKLVGFTLGKDSFVFSGNDKDCLVGYFIFRVWLSVGCSPLINLEVHSSFREKTKGQGRVPSRAGQSFGVHRCELGSQS